MIAARASALWITVGLTLIAGLATGLAIGGRRFRDRRPALRTSDSDASRPPIPVGAPTSASHDRAATNATPDVRAPDREVVARELWELVLSRDERGVSTLDKARLRIDLRPDLARFFIRKFRESDPRTRARQMSLEMALSCGGPDAVAFLEEYEATQREQPDRGYLSIIGTLLSWGHHAPRPKAFPISETLSVRMRELLATGTPVQRGLSVSLHGFLTPAEAVPVLMSVLDGDVDASVRSRAVRELGRLGDATTLAHLRANRDLIIAQMVRLYQPPPPIPGMPSSRGEDLFTRPVDDAIEQLAERVGGK